MSNATILVIDDETQIRKLLSITLQSFDYKVIEATTAKEGITAVSSHPPDLVLLDLGLPDQSGHEVLRHLREWYSNPVIILSVQSNEEDIGSDTLPIHIFNDGTFNIYSLEVRKDRISVEMKVYGQQIVKIKCDHPRQVISLNSQLIVLGFQYTEARILEVTIQATDMQGSKGAIEVLFH